ncbi:thioredoxin family protein [Polaribacter septentrionalilitoris]|uniref:thioredoxin family protein n=1 Tax=Polaribacter septentrionalilitoris TaxID=2494657 RepID=UPI00135A6E21|nr:thioredoxin family protein [Polaribacter septentrionalilitoris]
MRYLKSILVVAVLAIASAFTTNIEDSYKIGDTVEDFKLKNIDDKMVSLSDYPEAKGFIIVFTCNMCPYSVANEDRIIALDKKYKGSGYPVIAINPNDPKAMPGDGFAEMKVRAKEKGFTFPYLLDEGQKVYPKFGASRTPHVYIVSKPEMKLEYIGAIDNSSRNPNKVTEKYVENAVDALLAGKKPTKTETRAIGCSIKTL